MVETGLSCCAALGSVDGDGCGPLSSGRTWPPGTSQRGSPATSSLSADLPSRVHAAGVARYLQDRSAVEFPGGRAQAEAVAPVLNTRMAKLC